MKLNPKAARIKTEIYKNLGINTNFLSMTEAIRGWTGGKRQSFFLEILIMSRTISNL